jgi:hypothetical protein
MNTSSLRRLLGTLVMAIAVLAVAASTAFASSLHTNNDLIYSGNNHWAGPYKSNVYWVNAWSTGSAYGRTYVVNSSGVRVSADDYCGSPGCAAVYDWGNGPYPNGYGAAHNHGNESPSHFYGYIEGS